MKNEVLIGMICLAGIGCAVEPGEVGDDQPMLTAEQAIVGGTADTWRAYVVGVGNKGSAFCSGTVISRRTVITAGHCFGGTSTVYFGDDITHGAPLIVKVSRAIRHPGYNSASLENDLTILKLERDSPVQPAPLLRETMENNPTYIGPDYIFAGYGITDGVTREGFGIRRVVAFPIQAVGPATVGGTPGTIDATTFYFQALGKNTCNGDSGGPAFIVRDGVELHAGVTSSGDDPCLLDGTQARTDAPQIAGFIQRHIDEFEGSSPCRSNGVCDESCNTGAQLVDPDCAGNHCSADGICALSCAPRDPDCTGG